MKLVFELTIPMESEISPGFLTYSEDRYNLYRKIFNRNTGLIRNFETETLKGSLLFKTYIL